MNVALPKPGFGKIPERPSFDKKSLSAKANSGTTTNASQSTLKASVSKNISTATVSTECRSRAATRNTSTPFVAGQNAHVAFTRDRTVSVPHGAFAALGGKHQLASDMGMTGRSTQRLINNFEKQQQAQQMAYLNQMNMMYGGCQAQQQMSPIQMLGDLFALFQNTGLFGGSSAEKGGKNNNVKTANTVPSSDSNIAAMQNATTSADLSSAIDGAKGKVSELDGKISGAKGEINSLKGKTSGLKSAADGAATALTNNKTAIQNKTGEVQNNIQRESASQMAMNASQTQVDMLQKQLDALPPDSLARQGIESSLKQAKDQLKLKTEQYNQAVEDREQSQRDLQELKGQTQDLESKAATAKADYDNNVSTIASKESDVKNFEVLQRDMNDVIGQQETRLAELQEKESKDKKA